MHRIRKTCCTRKGNVNGCWICADRNQNCTGHECLISLIWLMHNRQTKQIQLSLECEWQTAKKFQEDDFRKLIFIKAKQKVFIFQTPQLWYFTKQDLITDLVKLDCLFKLVQTGRTLDCHEMSLTWCIVAPSPGFPTGPSL